MKNLYPTPHINATPKDFAKTVLMPGDPLRAKYIAETHLTDLKQINSVRNVLGFTGNYKGKPVSVMASGMGMPSISIYSHELYEGYGVENIIRVGTAGGLNKNLKLAGPLELPKKIYKELRNKIRTPDPNESLIQTLRPCIQLIVQ